jgi:hypothetical protein
MDPKGSSPGSARRETEKLWARPPFKNKGYPKGHFPELFPIRKQSATLGRNPFVYAWPCPRELRRQEKCHRGVASASPFALRVLLGLSQGVAREPSELQNSAPGSCIGSPFRWSPSLSFSPRSPLAGPVSAEYSLCNHKVNLVQSSLALRMVTMALPGVLSDLAAAFPEGRSLGYEVDIPPQ